MPRPLTLLVLGLALCGSPRVESQTLRLGVIAYEDADLRLQSLGRLFDELSATPGPPLQVEVALGTYAEVLHWVSRGFVDVAILSPGAAALVLSSRERGDPLAEYLVSEGLPAADTPWASEGRRRPGWHFGYRSAGVVASDSSLQSVEDLADAARRGGVRFLFVDRLSVSGHLAARHALAAEGIPVPAAELSFSHSRSLEAIASGGGDTVAFVFDGAESSGLNEASSGIRVLPFARLAQMEIPTDAWVTRLGYPDRDRLRDRLLSLRDDHGARFRAGSPEDFRDVAGWLRESELGSDTPWSLTEIVAQLRHYQETHGHSPRLGLVLSGGGAKCSYQVGAVGGIEEHLAQVRRPDEPWLDLQVVVGTSGGAINALPVAVGVTSTPGGRERLALLWEGLELSALVRPSLWVALSIGIWWAGMVVTLGALTLFGPAPSWVRVVAGAGLALLIVLPAMPGNWFGTHRPLRLLGLWWGFGWPWVLLALPPFLFAARSWYRRDPRPRIGLALALVLGVLLPAITTLFLLFSQHTLFGGVGVARKMLSGFSGLFDVEPAGTTLDERLAALSREIVEEGRVVRDLVITGSALPPTTPTDRYFYLPGDGSNSLPPSFGRRGVALAEHPTLLVDVVMGSGTIFPVFPSRRLSDFPRAGDTTRLVDGGFVHNSPVEAAVQWGATHVLVIEASPRAERSDAEHLVGSSLRAFQFLYDQAQITDVRTREQVVIFTLRPQPPHPSILDFSPAFIRPTVEKGRRDAEGRRFVRQSGQPRFRPLSSPPLGERNEDHVER